MPVNSILGVFAKSPIKPLQEHMDKVHDCASLLVPFFEATITGNWDSAVQLRKQISLAEKQADSLKREIRLTLPSGLFMPVERTDLLELLTQQDKIANKAKDISGRVIGRQLLIPQVMQVPFIAYLQRCIDAVALAKQVINELEDLLETGFRGREVDLVAKMINELDIIEEDTDDLQIQLRRQLFAMESELNPVDVMFLYKTIEWVGGLADLAERVGVYDKLPPYAAMSLGAGDTELMNLVRGYATFVNGGKKITPTMLDRVQNRYGITLQRSDQRVCEGCLADDWNGEEPPALPDTREQVLDPIVAFQVTHMMEGVVERGTGRRALRVGKPLAGKTGTTNDSLDTWFMGFSPDLAVGVFIGFDKPSTLGKGETGSSVAAPVFKEFMELALKNRPAIPFRIPPGIRLVRVNPNTGLLARSGERQAILEAFKPGTEPTGEEGVLDGSGPLASGAQGQGTPRGLY